jgi:hypothetical protein
MPNWCSNGLIVKGPKKDLDAFKATLNTKDDDGSEVPFSFAQTVPPPANLFRGNLGDKERAECEAKGIPTWYEWQSTNWGTKWDACEARVKSTKLRVNIWFDTAWAPPLAWLKSCAAKFPNLDFEMGYCECGMSFYGVVTATKGEVSDDGGHNIPDGCMDDNGNPKGVLKKHVNKYAIGTGG